MSAQVTEKHIDLVRYVLEPEWYGSSVEATFARLIADSEAKATAELRAILVNADQILDDIDTCSDAHKPMYSSYSQNVMKLCIKGREARRAILDSAIKKETT